MFLAEAWGHSSVHRRKIADIILLYKGHNNATIQVSCAGSNISQAMLVTMAHTGPTGRWINTYGGTKGTLMCHWVTCTDTVLGATMWRTQLGRQDSAVGGLE